MYDIKKIEMKNLIIIILCVFTFSSCKDERVSPEEIGIVNVINAITDSGPIKINPTGKPKSWSSFVLQIAYPAGTLYYATTGNANFTIVPLSDTTKTLFNRSFNLKPKMYSLYLSGTITAPDTMLREEIDYPNIVTSGAGIPPTVDSVVNVRFVNLSVNSPTLKVKLSTVITNEVDNLSYKSITAFKGYPARLTSTAYSFQIRRVDTDALVTTFNFTANSTNRFKNIAMVIRGVFGTTTGTAPFGVTVVNYY
jgi:hypothetical protein